MLSSLVLNASSILTTVCIVLANKKVLDHYEEPLIGSMLVPLHTLCTLLVTRGGDPADVIVPTVWLWLDAFVSMLSLFGSMLVLKFATVSFQQVGRLMALPLSAAVDRYFWGDRDFNTRKAICVVGIMSGFLLVCTDLENAVSLAGFLCNFLAVFGQVGSQTMVKLIAVKFHVNARDYLKQAAPYNFACSVLPLFIFGMVMKGKLNSLKTAFKTTDSQEVFPFVLLSCLLGVLVQFLSTWLSQISSAVSYALLTLLKSVCVIAAGAYVFAESFGPRMSVGTALCLTMFCGYLRMDDKLLRWEHVDIAWTHLKSHSLRIRRWRILGMTGIFVLGALSAELNIVPLGKHISKLTRTSSELLVAGNEQLEQFDKIRGTEKVVMFTPEIWVKQSLWMVPAVINASRSDWFTHSNVCIDQRDGTPLYWSLEDRDILKYETDLSHLQLSKATIPFRPKYVNWTEELRSKPGKEVLYLKGKSLVVQCWRNGGPNPVHFMFAHGKLFDTFRFTLEPFRLDHIVFHQCGNPTQIGPFFQFVWELIRDLGTERGFIDNHTNFFGTTSFPNRMFCMDSVEIAYHLWWIEGETGKDFARELMLHVGSVLPDEIKLKVLSRQKQFELSNNEENTVGSPCDRCVEKIRLSLYERPITDRNRRLLVNKDEIFDLFREYTSHVDTVTVGKDSTIAEVYDAFNSFDVLVTPHGSHMLNVLFTNSSRYALIEVTGSDLYSKADEVRHWSSIVPYYDLTFPHTSTEAELQIIINNSSGPLGGGLHAQKVMQSNLIVNITLLRDVLQGALDYLCNCSIALQK